MYRYVSCVRAAVPRFIGGLCVLLSLVGATAPVRVLADAREIDRVLVVVEDEVITESEFNTQLNAIKRQLKQSGRRIPPDDVLRGQILDRMVLDRIQVQQARREGISVNDKAVDAAVAGVARNNRLTLPQLRKALANDGIAYEDFRKNVADQLLIRQLVDKEVNSRVVVTDSEVDNFLLTNPKGGSIDREYNVSHIVIAIPRNAPPDVIEALARRVYGLYQRLEKGLDFAQAAVEYSQGREALDGGSLGWRKAGELPDAFIDVLKKLKPGGLSPVMRSPNGFHILRLNDVREGEQSVTQTHVRHILIRPDTGVTVQEAKRKAQQLRDRIAAGEDFASLARANSEDTSSAIKGGDLGWVDPGVMVPQFESAMNELKVGELSEPVETRFGYHIIQVLERREQKGSDAQDRAKARAQIREGKARERYDQWVRQLRDEAYVNYLIERL